ncbi:hypothetical protein [Streptomyces sp. HNM1019]|uniref:hypothetical protein n=1 Tax=Streptomyces sp. HNM1019 TaxID=3424717 RepID=UPI003D783456
MKSSKWVRRMAVPAAVLATGAIVAPAAQAGETDGAGCSRAHVSFGHVGDKVSMRDKKKDYEWVIVTVGWKGHETTFTHHGGGGTSRVVNYDWREGTKLKFYISTAYNYAGSTHYRTCAKFAARA